MDIDRIVKFLMPGKIKLIVAMLLFVVLPALLIADHIEILWMLGGLILISLSDFISPLNYVLLFIEAYVIACIIVNYFAPDISKPGNPYTSYPTVRRKTN